MKSKMGLLIITVCLVVLCLNTAVSSDKFCEKASDAYSVKLPRNVFEVQHFYPSSIAVFKSWLIMTNHHERYNMLYPFDHKGFAGTPIMLPVEREGLEFEGLANNGIRFFTVAHYVAPSGKEYKYLYTFKLKRRDKGAFKIFDVKEYSLNEALSNPGLWEGNEVPRDIVVGDIAVIPHDRLLIALSTPANPSYIFYLNLNNLKAAKEGKDLVLHTFLKFDAGTVTHAGGEHPYRLSSLTWVEWRNTLVIGGSAWCAKDDCGHERYYSNRLWVVERRDKEPVLICDRLDDSSRLDGVEVLRDRGGDRAVLLYNHGMVKDSLFKIVNDLPVMSWR
jgi:hypothetical protein